MFKSNQQVIMKNGEKTTPFPMINKLTLKNSLKIDIWLHENALRLRNDEYLFNLIKSINPKKMTAAERSLLNNLLFE